MSQEDINNYYIYLEELLRALTGPGLNMAGINEALGKLCRIFRIEKGVTCFYDSPRHEKEGKGDVFVCYDSGRECEEAMKKRIVTDAMTVTASAVYMHKDSAPLTEDEREKVGLIIDTILTFMSRSRLQRIVEKLTFYDDDGYCNLRYFLRKTAKACEDGSIRGKVALRFNLKHFALVNREIGRSAGDLAMHNYIQLLNDACKSSDAVCRVGGDNFIALIDKEELADILPILNGTQVVCDVNDDRKVKIAACCGVFVVPSDYQGGTDGIMDSITAAVESARKENSPDIVFYNQEMAMNKDRIHMIQKLLPSALEKEEFLVYYQPKVNIYGGNIIGAEALCRWQHDGKLIPPNDFIPALEETMDICRLDFYMLDHVCKDIRRWLDEGRNVVRVSINLSRRHMIDDDLLERIIAIIDENGVPHKYIEIELTETTTDVEFRDLKRVVSGLESVGIFTSVDDFGVGYTSLNLIKDVPWNVMKVDRSFLPLEEESKQSTRSIMFRYIVAMARELGLECIVEGVETRSQVDILKDNDCELAQGYYYDKPLPVSEFEDRMIMHKYDIA